MCRPARRGECDAGAPRDGTARRAALQILLLRAHALAGDTDALAHVGETEAALALLAQLPPPGEGDAVAEREAWLYARTGAALAAFQRADDVHAEPFRLAPTQVLDHHFLVGVGGPQGTQTDLSSSPHLMLHMLAEMPPEPIEDLGNHLLFALCMRAAALLRTDAAATERR